MAKRTQEQAIERRLLKRINNQGEPYEVRPLTARGRVRWDEGDYCDSYTEYGFLSSSSGKPLDGNKYTDEEIREFIDDSMVMRIYSPYDCTGKAFTVGVDWHRNPSGLISYKHYIGFDV